MEGDQILVEAARSDPDAYSYKLTVDFRVRRPDLVRGCRRGFWW